MNNNVITTRTNDCPIVLEPLESIFKGWMRDVYEEVFSKKMCKFYSEDKMLNSKELCQRWGISKNTLRNWEKDGIIKSVPLGGKKKMYSMEDVHDVENNGRLKNFEHVELDN